MGSSTTSSRGYEEIVIHFCIDRGCHTNPSDILIHGQSIIMKELKAMALTLTQVKADFDKYKTDVAAAFARLQASIDANTLDPQALQDLDDAINSGDADAVAEDPDVPVEPPVTTE